MIFHVSIETWKWQAVSVSEERKRKTRASSRLKLWPLSSRPILNNLVMVSRHVFSVFYAIWLSPFTPYKFPQLFTLVGLIWIIGLSWIAMCRY